MSQGDGSDLFGATAGVAVSNVTQPSSRRWDGADSGLIISGISAPGATMRFTVGAPEPDPATVVRGEATPALAIPDDVPAGVSRTITLGQAGTARTIKVGIDIAHTYIGDLIVELTSPGGRRPCCTTGSEERNTTSR